MTPPAPTAARHASHWLRDADGAAGPPLTGRHLADVVIVGGGFTGLWTALSLTEREPGRRVVLLEAERVGHGASGRNGGFVEPSLTHGIANARRHFPDEVAELTRLGHENLHGLLADAARFGVADAVERTGLLEVATAPWQVDELAEAAALHAEVKEHAELLGADAVRAEVDSPTYLGGLHLPDGGALVDPGRLVRALAAEAMRRGVQVCEGSPVVGFTPAGPDVVVRTPQGQVLAGAAVLATNAYSHRVLRRTARHFVPVHDYVLLTAPLNAEQLARIGWRRRQGIADAGNQFHYYRLTADDRILWGGYDAVYRFGNGVGPRFDHRRATYDLLARHFRATFPQLADVRFERWWGGPIATTTRFTVTFGDALGGRVHYALGYTGLGVAATRFAGRVLADRLTAADSPLLRLAFTSTSPVPFPPEPLRWVGVQATRSAMARADRRGGRRGSWLALLDRFGIGFDS
ncbi:NAD(P)/FAD-dependent oxidoreductase [Egicoccus halophilus]|uniref:Oxidoreductase n=1 Tax=Egicoccus halophilus TaxID=1670830 RepID=A0A8J3ABE8_9ACTN|nr:FAD-dependent oxidoreductase [Egicoccus halophilus]GGI04062.1 oxidoreductase [Egicoccus halophilus]